jgi:hypothetical protein
MQLSLRTTIVVAGTLLLAAPASPQAQSNPPSTTAALPAVPAGPPLSAELKPRAVLMAMERVAD